MIRKIAILCAALTTVALTGCASGPSYQCPMPDACAPVHDNYNKALKDHSWGGWTVDGSSSSEKDSGDKGSSSEKPKAVRMEMAPKPFVATGKPVYVPPTPWRMWLAPTPAGDGSIASGSYVWFVTPGHWDYLGNKWPSNVLGANVKVPDASGGTIDENGDLSPIQPNQLGFTPGATTQRQGILSNMVQPQE